MKPSNNGGRIDDEDRYPFAEFYRDTHRLVKHIIRTSVFDEGIAEQLTQDVWERFLMYCVEPWIDVDFNKRDPKLAARMYLVEITRNVAKTYQAKARQQDQVVDTLRLRAESPVKRNGKPLKTFPAGRDYSRKLTDKEQSVVDAIINEYEAIEAIPADVEVDEQGVFVREATPVRVKTLVVQRAAEKLDTCPAIVYRVLKTIRRKAA